MKLYGRYDHAKGHNRKLLIWVLISKLISDHATLIRMKQQIIFNQYKPVVIGGVGGSGTRLLTRVLEELDYYMGSDFNEARDNLWYALLFVRSDILYLSRKDLLARVMLFINAMVEGQGISQSERKLMSELVETPVSHGPLSDTNWLRKRADFLISAASQDSRPFRNKWGWKHPNTHIILDSLNEFLPQMRYIHVARNGLDMAYSRNQNQLKLWGPHLMGLNTGQVDPYHSLKYWCYVHQRVLDVGERMGNRFFFLNYDELCAKPRLKLHSLCQFLGVDVSQDALDGLVNLVEPPLSIGRFRSYDCSVFDPDDISYVASLGFDTRDQVRS